MTGGDEVVAGWSGRGLSEGGCDVELPLYMATPPVCVRCRRGVSGKRREHYLCTILFGGESEALIAWLKRMSL